MTTKPAGYGRKRPCRALTQTQMEAVNSLLCLASEDIFVVCAYLVQWMDPDAECFPDYLEQMAE